MNALVSVCHRIWKWNSYHDIKNYNNNYLGYYMYLSTTGSSNLNTNMEHIILLAESQSCYQQGQTICYFHFTIN